MTIYKLKRSTRDREQVLSGFSKGIDWILRSLHTFDRKTYMYVKIENG